METDSFWKCLIHKMQFLNQWSYVVFLKRDENAPKKIEDANAKKPDGWLDDEPELIPDPQAVRPEDWWVAS